MISVPHFFSLVGIFVVGGEGVEIGLVRIDSCGGVRQDDHHQQATNVLPFPVCLCSGFCRLGFGSVSSNFFPYGRRFQCMLMMSSNICLIIPQSVWRCI